MDAASSFRDNLFALQKYADEAAERASADRHASAVLLAVVTEFREKTHSSAALVGEDGEQGIGSALHEAVIEAEQAADSALRAARADPLLADATRSAIEGAHDAASRLKRMLPVSSPSERSPDQEAL